MSERTTFAGLEVLAPTDPLSSDGFRFQLQNPKITDTLLKLGAQLHRHDEHAALVTPSTVPTLTQAATGGGISGGVTIYAAFTKVDANGGESLPSAPSVITTPAAPEAPTNAPTATLNYVTGALLSNTYTYALTVQDGKGGETAIGPPITVFVLPGFAHAEVVLTNLKVIAEEITKESGSGWRLWRSQNGGPYDLIATGSGAEVKDDGTLTVDCNVEPPPVSTITSANELKVVVPAPSEIPAAEFFRLYLSTSATFESPCLVAQYPISEYGKTLAFKELVLAVGSPPLVSTSIAGAHKLDPNTELIEWHWKRPVTKLSELPTGGNEEGDVRVVAETGTIWIWDNVGKAWHSPQAVHTTQEHPYALEGAVAAGERPGWFVELSAGETKTIHGMSYALQAGTSAEITIKKNGVAIVGLTKIEVTEAVLHITGLAVALSDKDFINLDVLAVTGAVGLSATIYDESVATK